MAFRQLVSPNLAASDATGMCLRMVQRIYQNRNLYYYKSAWIAWENAAHKRTTRGMPDVSVPVYFSHWGTYGEPAEYANWGHIVAWVPGRGFLSSPAGGYGATWFPNIESIEAAFNCQFVGWALDIGGLTVADTTTTPAPKPVQKWEDTMKPFAGKSERTKPQVIGDKEAHVTFLDDHSDSKWGDRTLMRGPGTIVSSYITVTFEGDPGTRVALRLIRETAAGKNVYEYKPARATIDTFGRAVVQIGVAADLKDGQLVRLKAQAQSGAKVTVTGFTWDGIARPSV